MLVATCTFDKLKEPVAGVHELLLLRGPTHITFIYICIYIYIIFIYIHICISSLPYFRCIHMYLYTKDYCVIVSLRIDMYAHMYRAYENDNRESAENVAVKTIM